MIRRLAARLACWLAAYAGDNDNGATFSRTDMPVDRPPLPDHVQGAYVPDSLYTARYRTAVNR